MIYRLFPKNYSTSKKHNKNGYAIKEGLSRCISQSVVYSLERKKTQIQIFGSSIIQNKNNSLYIGCATSGITAGIVYTIYFTVYNNLINQTAAASIIAGLITSIVKIPIGNSMRLLQSSKAVNFFNAAKILYREKGLYKGYKISVIEDIIEMDMRIRIYDFLTRKINKESNISLHTIIGSMAGICASGITTPFDTIRSRMIYNKPLYLHNLYDGVQLRLLSNALKSGTFYLFYQIISNGDE
jgi:hypothetical protein